MKDSQMKWLRPFPLLILAFLLLATPQLVAAHSRTEIGPYVVIVGWESEPPIVGERNALTVEVHDQDGQPIAGVDASIDLEVLYAGRTFRSNLVATQTAGLYTAEIFPTVRGQYAVHLLGNIEDEFVDVTLEPEEVFSAARLQFPEAQPDARDLQEEIASLETAVSSARTMAFVGIGLGVIGLLLGLVAFLRTQTKKS